MLAVVFLLVSAAVPVYADTLYPRLTDEADVLTDSEEAEILEKLDKRVCRVVSLQCQSSIIN